jgi:hypothetical protein
MPHAIYPPYPRCRRGMVRPRLNARELETWRFTRQASQAPVTSDFIEARDLVYRSRATFSHKAALPAASITYYTPLKGEENLHASHPRAIQKANNLRAIPRYTDYQQPWINVAADFVPPFGPK